MCWSKEVSLGLGLCGVVMTLDQLRRWKNGQHKSISVVLVYFLYSFMELFQFTQYMVGFETCDQKNEYMTLIAHILIWIQPICLNYHSFAYTKKNKPLMRFALFGSIAAAITSSYALYLGYYASKAGLYVSTNERIHNIGPELCTKATDIHFSWFFPYDSLDGYRPMGFVWILLAAFPHLFRTDEYTLDDWFVSGPLYGSLGVIAFS
eukprot:gene4084-7373_t